MTSILGISAFYHDSAAALVVDGEIIAAAQEERFSRIKHDARYPAKAIQYVLNEAKINLKQIENLAGLSTRNDDHKALLEEPTKDNLSIFIGELRTLTEKRSQIKDSLHKVDDELIKLQEKIYKNKKIYEDKIAQLESINEIYSQSANIVSKIISEDTKYEQL